MVYKVYKMITSKAVVPFNIHGDSHKIAPGWPSYLNQIESNLLHALFEWREQGLQVNSRTVHKEAFQLSRDFREKSRKTKISNVS